MNKEFVFKSIIYFPVVIEIKKIFGKLSESIRNFGIIYNQTKFFQIMRNISAKLTDIAGKEYKCDPFF
jgi:hypothetical protein